MANSVFRCCNCKDYFPVGMAIVTNIGKFCGNKCKHQKISKQKTKEIRKAKERRGEAPSVSVEAKWLEQIQKFVSVNGSFPLGNRLARWQHHHVLGRKARVDGVEVGRWVVLPVEFKYHDVSSNHELNLTKFPARYAEAFCSDLVQWLSMCEVIKAEQGVLLVPDSVIEVVRAEL